MRSNKREQSAVLIAKTQQGLVPQPVDRVKRLHSYACSSIVAWPVQTGHQPYLDWIEKETR